LATLHEAVLEFLRGRKDVVVFGATAVNAYVSEPRMTQDIDLMSTRAAELAEEMRAHLSERFHIAVRVHVVGAAKGFRIFQIRKEGNRHLVDVRPVTSLPASQQIEDVAIVSPADLIALKVISYHTRQGKPKSFLDRRDLAMLLLAFPDLKTESGAVESSLKALDVSEGVMAFWRELVSEEIQESSDEEEFDSFSS